MQIEAGKFYRARDGQKVGPMRSTKENYPWAGPLTNEENRADCAGFNDDGSCPHISQYDLIAEWTDEPVGHASYPGMSVRDWFAGQSIASVIALAIKTVEDGTESRSLGEKDIAEAAYAMADAMLAERNKP